MNETVPTVSVTRWGIHSLVECDVCGPVGVYTAKAQSAALVHLSTEHDYDTAEPVNQEMN